MCVCFVIGFKKTYSVFVCVFLFYFLFFFVGLFVWLICYYETDEKEYTGCCEECFADCLWKEEDRINYDEQVRGRAHARHVMCNNGH